MNFNWVSLWTLAGMGVFLFVAGMIINGDYPDSKIGKRVAYLGIFHMLPIVIAMWIWTFVY